MSIPTHRRVATLGKRHPNLIAAPKAEITRAQFDSLVQYAYELPQSRFLDTIIPNRTLTTEQALRIGATCIREPVEKRLRGLWIPRELMPEALSFIAGMAGREALVAEFREKGLIKPANRWDKPWTYRCTRKLGKTTVKLEVPVPALPFAQVTKRGLAAAIASAKKRATVKTTEVKAALAETKKSFKAKTKLLATSRKRGSPSTATSWTERFELALATMLKKPAEVVLLRKLAEDWHKSLDDALVLEKVANTPNHLEIWLHCENLRGYHSVGLTFGKARDYESLVASGASLPEAMQALVAAALPKLSGNLLLYPANMPPNKPFFALVGPLGLEFMQLPASKQSSTVQKSLSDQVRRNVQQNAPAPAVKSKQKSKPKPQPISLKSNLQHRSADGEFLPEHMQAQYQNHLLIFSDASARDVGGLAAVILPGPKQDCQVLTRTVAKAKIDDLEVCAALMGLHYAATTHPEKPAVVMLDNSGAVKRLLRAKTDGIGQDPGLAALWPGLDVTAALARTDVCWVKGHSGCRGNVLADQHAGRASK